jgi:hypothetical protein
MLEMTWAAGGRDAACRAIRKIRRLADFKPG